jgi:GAF domain-containing protein
LEEKEFDDITAFAARQFKVPIVVISLVDENRQWFKSHFGLAVSETPRDMAFCSHAILENETLVVNNALEDERFADNPLVQNNPHIRFYAGHPLKSHDGYNLGTLCVIDNKSRNFSEQDKQKLIDLTAKVQILLEMRLVTLKLKNMSNTKSA